MAFSVTLSEHGVMGDMRYELYSLTDVQDDSSSTFSTGMARPRIAIPVIEKASGDSIDVVSISGRVITLDATTADDDGKLMVYGV